MNKPQDSAHLVACCFELECFLRRNASLRFVCLSTVSPRRRTTVGCGGAEAGLAFVEIQRDLLSQLEGLFVTIADDR